MDFLYLYRVLTNLNGQMEFDGLNIATLLANEL